MAVVLFAIVVIVSSGTGAALHDRSAEEIADEVKAAILQDWKKDLEFENATIQSVSLTHKGGGHYSGFIEATVGGQRERLPLEVMLDRGIVRWEIEPEAN